MFAHHSKDLIFLQEGYSKAAMLIASEKHEEAENLINDLVHRVQALRPRSGDFMEEQQHGKMLSECFVNLASCLFNREDSEDSFDRIKQLLGEAIVLDSLNHWAYYNLASYLFRISSYRQALQNIHCCLSCLYLLKAVLSRDLQNRNREIDLGRAIGYCQNNLKARLVRLLMQIKQSRWKMAINEVELALEGQHADSAKQLEQLKTMLLAASGSNNTQLSQVRSILKHAIDIISQIPPQKNRLQATVKMQLEKGAILKQIDDKMVQFNEVFRQVNELGSSQNLFMLKAIHRTNKADKKIHIISNAVHPTVKEEAHLAESTPLRPNSVELQAKVIERMNESKKSLTESKGYGQSLFQLTKSQNLENSNKYLPGSLLSSLIPTAKPFRILPSEVQQLDNQNQTLNDNNSIRKAFDIQAIQSQIQPLPEHESALLSGYDPKMRSNVNQQDDLLLDSLYDRDFKKTKPSQVATPPPLTLRLKQEELSTSGIYPLTEASAKVLELVLIRADFREDFKQKLINIYANLEYNSGFIETFKFKSRQVSGQGVNDVEWGESLGFIKLAEEPKSMLVKVYKSEAYYYNDKFLGEGEIEVTTVGIIKIPLYLNMRNVGSVSIRLLPGQEGLNSSFKRSHTSNSNYSSSMKSESQSSQHS